METQKIDWKTLHSWQRDQLMAEKIFGIPDLHCLGKLEYRGDNTMLRQRYYLCQHCHATLTITDAFPVSWKPSVHTKLLPRYSGSMDAAWLIVQHFAKLHDQPFEERWKKQLFFAALDVPPCSDPDRYDITLGVLASWTPEKLCLAALSAYGIEVCCTSQEGIS